MPPFRVPRTTSSNPQSRPHTPPDQTKLIISIISTGLPLIPLIKIHALSIPHNLHIIMMTHSALESGSSLISSVCLPSREVQKRLTQKVNTQASKQVSLIHKDKPVLLEVDEYLLIPLAHCCPSHGKPTTYSQNPCQREKRLPRCIHSIYQTTGHNILVPSFTSPAQPVALTIPNTPPGNPSAHSVIIAPAPSL